MLSLLFVSFNEMLTVDNSRDFNGHPLHRSLSIRQVNREECLFVIFFTMKMEDKCSKSIRLNTNVLLKQSFIVKFKKLFFFDFFHLIL